MTEEKLKQEAIQFAKYYSTVFCVDGFPLYKAFLKVAEPREKRIAELEAQLESERDLPAIAYIQGAEKQKKKDTDQLTKAKEILQEFVEWANWQGNSKCPSFKSIQDKAEQFLKESE